jgi:hypothetical protein
MKYSNFIVFWRRIFTLLTVLVLAFLLVGCNSTKMNKDQTSLDTGSSINKDLLVLIQKYIFEYDGYFIDEDWLYYNVLFWSSDSKSYLTIWVFVTYPTYIEECFPEKKVLMGIESINERKVVFIIPELELDMYNPSESSIAAATLESKRPFEGPIYDGPHFEATYYLDMSYQDGVSFQCVETNFPVLNCTNLNDAIEIDE